ncbi:O-methyltransferase [Lachnospiraceae bacterium MD1]|uniref:tRNA 5-hydroxyuridine methyltransferase n=1 Tax=Variimorphobacter saccharofermentans TaxID=2755051 RepID=A0A839JZ66_9FIRM|nr:O-methyltransferase [Variimorphobacter saccharofermentans]MBB2182507.1 O-methyltransferase [Variimorphobacter saccharofermentans]
MIVNERIVAYINSLQVEIKPELLSLEKEALERHVPIIKKETQGLLKFLLCLQQPKRILEVGTAIGFSALFMSEYTGDDSKITTIEKVPMRIVDAEKNFSNEVFSHKDKITLIKGEALKALKDLASEEQHYDFIFLDAAKAQYMSFLPELMKMLSTNGILVTDNVLQDGTVTNSRYSITRRDRTIHTRMREYLYTITHMEELETVILPVGDGVAVSFRK